MRIAPFLQIIELPRLAGRCFLGSGALLLFLSYPCALLPPGSNPDAPALRLTAIGGFLLLAGAALIWRRRSWTTRLCLAAAGLLAALVAAVLPGGLNGWASHFPLPSLYLLSLFALPVWLGVPGRCARLLWGLAGLWLAICLIQTALHPGNYVASLEYSGFVTIPLAVAALAPEAGSAWRYWQRVLAALWLLSVVYGLWQQGLHFPQTGIALNPNWQACVIVVTWPWALLELQAWVGPRPWARWALAGTTVALTLLLVYLCQTRAAVLAVAAYVFLWVWWRLGKAWARALWTLLPVVAVLLACWQWPAALQAANARDIRLPLWQACGRQVALQPWLGAGPGEFERVIAEQLPRTTYFLRQVAAPRTEHAHNQFLEIACELGLPAALLWLLLFLPLLRFPGRDRPAAWQAAHFAAVAGLTMAMFDKSLFQEPSRLLILVVLGLAWPFLRRPAPEAAAGTAVPAALPVWRLGVLAAVLALSSLVVADAFRLSLAAWYFRRGVQYDRASPADPAKSYRHFARAAALVRGNAPYEYAAAAEALHLPNGLPLALPHLRATLAANPNFAYVNRIAGRCLLAQGRPVEAQQLLAREFALHPCDPESLQWLYTAAALNAGPAQAGDLLELARREREILRLRLSWESDDRRRNQALAWQAAVRRGELPAAAAAAEELLSGLVDERLEDPLWQRLGNGGERPGDFLARPPGAGDLAYWQLWERRQIVLRKLSHEGSSAAAQAAALWRQVAAAGPDAAWARLGLGGEGAQAAALASACRLAWLAEGWGWIALLPPAGEPVRELWLLPEGEVLAVELATGAVRPLSGPAEIPAGARQFFLPQAFSRRNLLLLLAADELLGRRLPGETTGALPSVWYWGAQVRLGRHRPADPATVVVQEPFAAIEAGQGPGERTRP